MPKLGRRSAFALPGIEAGGRAGRRGRPRRALLAGRIDARGKNVVIVLSGGNVDADLFARINRLSATRIRRRTRSSRPGSGAGSAPADRVLMHGAFAGFRSR